MAKGSSYGHPDSFFKIFLLKKKLWAIMKVCDKIGQIAKN
jgi:hypothetical protein